MTDLNAVLPLPIPCLYESMQTNHTYIVCDCDSLITASCLYICTHILWAFIAFTQFEAEFIVKLLIYGFSHLETQNKCNNTT